MIIALALSGCGIPQEQYEQLESELTSSQQQLEELNTKIENLSKEIAELEDLVNNSATLNEELSAIVAYFLWYDYYYGTGAYSFDDVTAFNSQLDSLIAAIDDTNSRAAFDVYDATHYDYTTLVDSLPEDNIWTLSQYESWSDAGKSRKEALEQVGVHLLNKLEAIRWFGEK
jgi:vacuolar-type H+-ATPase subunit I/STV1